MDLFDGCGQLLRELRESKGPEPGGWSREKLAERSGLSKETIQNIEGKRGNPTVRSLGKLLRALDVSLLDFVTRLLAHQGVEVPDSAAISEREAKRDEFARKISTDIPFDGDPIAEMLREIHSKLEAIERYEREGGRAWKIVELVRKREEEPE